MGAEIGTVHLINVFYIFLILGIRTELDSFFKTSNIVFFIYLCIYLIILPSVFLHFEYYCYFRKSSFLSFDKKEFLFQLPTQNVSFKIEEIFKITKYMAGFGENFLMYWSMYYYYLLELKNGEKIVLISPLGIEEIFDKYPLLKTKYVFFPSILLRKIKSVL